MEHPCSVCGEPDESGHEEGMCCEGCTCTQEPEDVATFWQPDTVEEARGDK